MTGSDVLCVDLRDGPDKRCDICGAHAIGIQVMGCCGFLVCEEHADPQLKSLSPGEKREWGACYFYRF
ncbi:MAG: hypothetical protein NQU46_07705 [Methanolinea sp.]|nr:hypothetical protein [Methanolinea sp.]